MVPSVRKRWKAGLVRGVGLGLGGLRGLGLGGLRELEPWVRKRWKAGLVRGLGLGLGGLWLGGLRELEGAPGREDACLAHMRVQGIDEKLVGLEAGCEDLGRGLGLVLVALDEPLDRVGLEHLHHRQALVHVAGPLVQDEQLLLVGHGRKPGGGKG